MDTILNLAAVISLDSITRLFVATETWCFSCEIRTVFLYIIQINFALGTKQVRAITHRHTSDYAAQGRSSKENLLYYGLILLFQLSLYFNCPSVSTVPLFQLSLFFNCPSFSTVPHEKREGKVKFGYKHSICLTNFKNHLNLNSVGRSQGLQDAH
jgi:hypothetical protein